jgi:hypothetical protein
MDRAAAASNDLLRLGGELAVDPGKAGTALGLIMMAVEMHGSELGTVRMFSVEPDMMIVMMMMMYVRRRSREASRHENSGADKPKYLTQIHSGSVRDGGMIAPARRQYFQIGEK